MPSTANVTAPVSLHGCGRSGTTLMTEIFRNHPDFQSIGETSNLIYTASKTIQQSLPFCAADMTAENASTHSTKGVRALLTTLFPSDRPRWFHKPIMLPISQWRFDQYEDFMSWYWKTARELFPDGHFFAILREPSEVVTSYMKRWNRPLDVTMLAQQRTLDLMAHPDSCIQGIIRFEDLAGRPRETVERLFAMINVDFHPDVMRAFRGEHASNSGRGSETGPIEIGPEITDVYNTLIERHDILAG